MELLDLVDSFASFCKKCEDEFCVRLGSSSNCFMNHPKLEKRVSFCARLCLIREDEARVPTLMCNVHVNIHEFFRSGYQIHDWKLIISEHFSHFASRTIFLPMLSPRKSATKADGMLSTPCEMSSRTCIFPFRMYSAVVERNSLRTFM